jgi:UDP-3-O-[3-hydroxymyristoyl] glucosamine N-acyltransferase
MKLTVEQLSKQLEAELICDAKYNNRQINSVGPVDTATENIVTFVTGDKHKDALKKSHAGAVIISKAISSLEMPQLIVKNVNKALISTMDIFAPELKAPIAGIDSTAIVASDVKIGKGVSIAAGVIIDDGVEIGENSIIGSGCKIGQNVKIGKNCRLDSNVVIYYNCCLGNNIVIQANSTIGSSGFGYYFIEGVHRLIPHNGGVIIEDFVEIGANCCIDRAKFGNTIVGAGTKIDNLVQIAHNVIIGKCCLIAAQVGISGSTKLGDGVVMGGQSGLRDNIVIGQGAMIGAQAGVINNVPAGQKLAWTPALEWNEAMRIKALTRRLPKLFEQLKQLSNKVENLEIAKNDKE